MKKEYYWKVVRVVWGNYVSSIIYEGKFCLRYGIGIRTKTALTDNGILVFETRKQARLFRKSFLYESSIKIFKCKVFGNEIIEPPFYDIIDLKRGEVIYSGHNYPIGTHSFPEIELISKE